MAIIVTDGRSDDEDATWREAIAARESGIEVQYSPDTFYNPGTQGSI